VRQAIVPAGSRFLGIWLQAPLAELEQRVAARTADASDATVAVLQHAAQDDPGAGDWLSVDATDRTQTLEAARQAIAAMLPPGPAGSGDAIELSRIKSNQLAP
jgi:uncharacterized protein